MIVRGRERNGDRRPVAVLSRQATVGQHFSVRSSLNLPRPPRGHPVVVQAGSPEAGRALAARTAEVIFTVQASLSDAKTFYADVKGRMARHGRDPNAL